MADLIRYEEKLKVILDSTLPSKGWILTPYANKWKVISHTTQRSEGVADLVSYEDKLKGISHAT